MSINQISIWNRALGFLGARGVAAEQENTPEALQCRLYWDTARRQVLRDFPGNFAQRRAWLAPQALPEGYAPEFGFAYALPDLCLKVHAVRHQGLAPRPFRLGRNAAGDAPLLLTDSDRALALYTEDVQNPRLFDDLFAHILARKLAALVAVPLLKDAGQQIAALEKLYAADLPRAQAADASERRERPAEDPWLLAR